MNDYDVHLSHHLNNNKHVEMLQVCDGESSMLYKRKLRTNRLPLVGMQRIMYWYSVSHILSN